MTLSLLVSCRADDVITSDTGPAAPRKIVRKPAMSKPAAPSTSAKAAANGTARNAVTKKPLRSPTALRTEVELSGFTSETSDQFYTRLNVGRSTPKTRWWIRTDYRFTESRTYGRKKVAESSISGYNLDTEFRRNGKNNYRFVSVLAGLKKRSPHSVSYWDESKYSIFSVGYGKTVLPGLELEVALAQINQEKEDESHRITPLYSLRMKSPLNPSLTLDADMHFAEPWSDDDLVDIRTNLTYRLTQALSMRLTYVANNVLGTSLTKREWDKSIRVSLVFSR